MQKNGFDKKNGYFKSGRQYEWYEDGQLHNEDGPAYRSPKGDLQWWIMACSTVKTVLPLSTRMVIKNGSFVVESTVKVPCCGVCRRWQRMVV